MGTLRARTSFRPRHLSPTPDPSSSVSDPKARAELPLLRVSSVLDPGGIMRAFLWLFVLIPAGAVAGDLSDPLLEALVAEALEASPELKGARASEKAAR